MYHKPWPGGRAFCLKAVSERNKEPIMQLVTHAQQPSASTVLSAIAPRSLSPVTREALLSLAPRPAYGVTLALAGLLSRRWQSLGADVLPIYGLSLADTRQMLGTHFPGASALIAHTELQPADSFVYAPELDALVGLLVAHRTLDDQDSCWLAHALATACLGREPLWQELGLLHAGLLCELFHAFFSPLAAYNRAGMDWRSFLYTRLAAQLQLSD
jgi:nitrogen fixation protein NifQ